MLQPVFFILFAWIACGVGGTVDAREPDRAADRTAMIEDIRLTAAEADAMGTGGVLDDRVLKAMASVPRHLFVPEEERKRAYANRPLPIGYGQTISQPYIVALMTDLLDVESGDRVFELGTGSGYQAAVLAALGCEVWTMEIVPELGDRAASALVEAGYPGIHFRSGDAYYGWEEAAPFDAIVVTAAGDHVVGQCNGSMCFGSPRWIRSLVVTQ